MRRGRLAGLDGVVKIGLIGKPGVGKSTSADLLLNIYRCRGALPLCISLGQPLRDMQAAFYERSGSQAVKAQDGVLLNFFGEHFRRSDPNFLIRDFEERCILALLGGQNVLICDDVRPTDVPALQDFGFSIVGIVAPDTLRRSRKRNRADRMVGDEEHITESGMEHVALDHTVRNAGVLKDLEDALSEVVNTAGLPEASQDNADLRMHQLCQLVAPIAQTKLHRYLTPRYVEHRHQIASLIVSDSGHQHFGLHIEAMVGRASSCAENSAVSQFCAAGDPRSVLLASLRLPRPGRDEQPRFVPPCGICRELLMDYIGDPFVLLTEGSDTKMTLLSSLFPNKYVGTKWSTGPK